MNAPKRALHWHGVRWHPLGIVGNVAVALLLAICICTIVQVAVLHRLRLQRAEQGPCVRCGYDLSGTPQHRCPDCGAGAEGP